MSSPIRLAVVDEHPIFRVGVVQAIKRNSKFLLVGEGDSVEDAWRLIRETSPDVLTFDISMPGGGVDAAIRLFRTAICNLLILTSCDDAVSIRKLLEAGVKGYLLKDASSNELICAIEAVNGGRAFIAQDLASRLLTEAKGGSPFAIGGRTCPATMSSREQQIMARISKGLTNKEIASQLRLSERTVKHYTGLIFKKFRVRNRVQAINLFSSSIHSNQCESPSPLTSSGVDVCAPPAISVRAGADAQRALRSNE